MVSLIFLAIAVTFTDNVYSSLHHGASSLPLVLHNGYLADTHEVAAAKSAHLAALSSSQLSDGYSGHNGYEGSSAPHGDYKYHEPIAIPHLLHDGHIADTHEVAAAKSEHLAAVAKAKAHGGYNSYNGYEGSHEAHGDYRYHGPTAIPHVLHDGHIADTHEVAAAKSEHLAAVAKAKAHGGYNSYNGYEGSHEAHGDYRYHGPTAIPHVLHNGHIADTHEVAAAKTEHLAAVAKAKAHGGYNSYNGYEGSHEAHGDYRYHGPTAIPHVLHNGHIADTHEVAAAKSEHSAAVAKAKAHGGYKSYNGYEGSHEAHGDYRYHGPTAIPHVLHDGHIADTHEVAAAKTEHLADVAKAKAHGGYNSYNGYEGSHEAHGDYRYHGPTAIPHVLHDGHIADTHEVAAANSEHLAAVAKAKAHGGYNSYNGYEGSHEAHVDYRYHGPTAIPHVLHDGHIADTHEVAAAKSEHLAAVAKAKAHGGYNSYNGYEGSHGAHGDYRYHGPTAIPHVLHDGHIADTHEVAAAKSEHLAAVAKAKAHGGYNSYNGYEGSYEAHGDYRYHGPTAIPHVLHDGHIADTHEVATAKSEHLAAVAKAKAHGGYNSYNGYGGSYEAHGEYKYHGPTAIPHVLHDGHIADTHEVAAAKSEHLAAVAKAKSHGHDYSEHNAGGYDHHEAAYHGPLAKPVVLSSGYLADTHEVAATRNSHLHLLHSRY